MDHEQPNEYDGHRNQDERSGDPVGRRLTNAVLYLLVSFIGVFLVAFVSFVFTKNSDQDSTIVRLDTTQKIVVQTLDTIQVNQQSMIGDLREIKGQVEQIVQDNKDDNYSRNIRTQRDGG